MLQFTEFMQFMVSQRVGHDLVTEQQQHTGWAGKASWRG